MFFISSFLFFFTDSATTEIYTLSLHDALPISQVVSRRRLAHHCNASRPINGCSTSRHRQARSEEHTSELQSRPHLVCRLLLEKKKNKKKKSHTSTKKTTTRKTEHKLLNTPHIQ